MSEKTASSLQPTKKTQPDESTPRKLLDQVSEALRAKRYVYCAEETCIDWIKRRPKDIGANEIHEFIA